MKSLELQTNHENTDRAESRLLGGLFRWNAAIADVAPVLRPEDFRQDFHGEAYRTILELWECGKPASTVSVADALHREGKDPGYKTLAEWWDAEPTGANTVHYAGIIRQASILRRLSYAGAAIKASADNPSGPAEEILEAAEKAIFEVADIGSSANVHDFACVVDDATDRIDARAQRGEGLSGIPTGFPDLDKLTSGLQPSELIVLAARPSVGKTALGLQIAAHVAAGHGLPVLFASLEQSRHELAERLLCSYARVDGQNVRRGMVDRDDAEKIAIARNTLRRAPLHIDDAASQGVLRIAANARRLKLRGGLALVVVDYLQLIRPDDTRAPRQEQVASISRRLKIMARELGVPVLALAQLNRGVEERAQQRPRLSDLRESGALEQDADVVILLHRAESLSANVVIDAIVAKQRNGPTGDASLCFEKRYMRFETYRTEPQPFAREKAFQTN